MTRAIVTAAAIALLASAACSKDKSKPDEAKPAADAARAPVKTADAAAPAALDAAAPPSADAAAPSGDGDSGDGDGDGDKPEPADPSKPDPDKPKNLKLLPKSWGIAKIKEAMKTYNKALGVKCDFCHDVKDFAADSNKHKKAARMMIGMTRAMNKKFFKGKPQVSCMTCHRGKSEP